MPTKVSGLEEPASQQPRPAVPPRVLLLSDDAEERAVIRDLLNEAARAGMPLGDVSLDTAGDYRQATVLAADFEYIAVLLGRLGSAPDGFTLLSRALAGRELPSPFLVLADGADPAAIQAAIADGAADVLNREELSAPMLERALRYALAVHQAETRAAGLQLVDETTGLVRQPLLWEVLTLAVRRARRNKDFLALLMVHLDCLEQPTGKPGIDPLAVVVPLAAKRLAHALRGSDTIARLENGHLGVLIESMPRAEDIQTVAEKIISTVSGRYQAEDRIFTLTVNVGISLYPTGADDAAGLMRNAAAAVLTARDKGVETFHFG